MTNEARLTIKVNDKNEFCPVLLNSSSEPFLFISRQRYLKKNPTEKLVFRLFAFDQDISDQSNITFELISSSYSKHFHLAPNGILTLNELASKLPSMFELDFLLRDTFIDQPCQKEGKLVILIGETNSDRDELIQQYEKEYQYSRHHRFMPHHFSSSIKKKQETLFIILAFSLSTLVIFIGIFSLLYLICCRKEKKETSIRTKSSSLLDDSKQQSPHSFITDCNGKSSLLTPLR